MSWGGIGGYYTTGNVGLIQAGTWEKPGPTYQGFYEWLNLSNAPPPVFPSSVHVYPGDAMYADVQYVSSQNRAYLFIEDDTNGTSASGQLYPASAYYDGRSVDYIAERPYSQFFGYSPLAKFPYVYFNYAEQEQNNGAWYYVGQQAYSAVIMKNGSKYLAVPSGLLNSRAFDVWWDACN